VLGLLRGAGHSFAALSSVKDKIDESSPLTSNGHNANPSVSREAALQLYKGEKAMNKILQK